MSRNSAHGQTRRQLPLRAAAVLVLVALAPLHLLITGCSDESKRERQPQVVRLLPDTPPPPPPPPPDRPPPPRPEDKPAPPAPQPDEQPQPQQLKTDEAPGDGPGSGLASGNVTQDYRGGAIVGSGEGDGGTGAARLAAASYASATTRALNDFLQRERALRQSDFRLQVHLWLAADGRIERAELVGSSGDAALDAALRDALQRFPGKAGPPPDRMPQPLRLQVSNRMLG